MTLIPQQINCSVCGKPKAAVNHWFLFAMPHVLSNEEYFSFEAKPWIEADVEWMNHACGAECLMKAMSRWMEQVKPEPVSEVLGAGKQ